MTDRAAQLRTLATSFYRELMRLDEMDTGSAPIKRLCTCIYSLQATGCDPAIVETTPARCPKHGDDPVHSARFMDPALDS